MSRQFKTISDAVPVKGYEGLYEVTMGERLDAMQNTVKVNHEHH
jgi:hypothetical protein